MNALAVAIHRVLAESSHQLERVFVDLVAIEADPTDDRTLSRLEDGFASLSCAYGLLGITQTYTPPTAACELVARVRSGDVAFSAEVAGALLAAVDTIGRTIRLYADSGVRDRRDHADLLHKLRRLQQLPAGPGGWAATCRRGFRPRAASIPARGVGPPLRASGTGSG
jgi:chemotaxis protein histidine kinase CheA